MGLQPPGLGPFHIFPDLLDLGCVHAVFGQSPLFEQSLTASPIRQVIDDLMKPGPYFRLIAVPDRL